MNMTAGSPDSAEKVTPAVCDLHPASFLRDGQRKCAP